MLQYKLAKFSFLYSDVLTVLSPCQLDLNIQLFLVVYVEAFFVLVCSKTNYHPALFALQVITEELGVSLKIMFDFDKLCCFQGTPEYLLNSYCEWFIVSVISIWMCLFE